MKIEHFFGFLFCMQCMYHVHSECCPTQMAIFVAKYPHNCSKLGYPVAWWKYCEKDSSIPIINICHADICGDGKTVTTGTFCGLGPCNIFGCNCDYGCVPGDPRINFKKNNPLTVWYDEFCL